MNAVAVGFPSDMVHGKTGVLVTRNNAVEIAIARAEDTLSGDIQQKWHLGDKSAVVFEQPVRHRRAVALLALTEIGHRAGDPIAERKAILQPGKGFCPPLYRWPVIGLWYGHIAAAGLASGERSQSAYVHIFRCRTVFSAAGRQTQRQCQAEKRRKESAPEQTLHCPPPSQNFPLRPLPPPPLQLLVPLSLSESSCILRRVSVVWV